MRILWTTDQPTGLGLYLVRTWNGGGASTRYYAVPEVVEILQASNGNLVCVDRDSKAYELPHKAQWCKIDEE